VGFRKKGTIGRLVNCLDRKRAQREGGVIIAASVSDSL
jgi:hypothetical protein